MIEASRKAIKAAAEGIASDLRAASKRQLLASANVDRFGTISGPGKAVGCLLEKGSSLIVDEGAYVEGVHLQQDSILQVGSGSVLIGGRIRPQKSLLIGRDCVLGSIDMDCDSVCIADGARMFATRLKINSNRPNHNAIAKFGNNCVLLHSGIQGMCKEFRVGDDYLAAGADLIVNSRRHGNVQIGSNVTLLTTFVQRSPLQTVRDVPIFIAQSIQPHETTSILELSANEDIYIGNGVLSSANMFISAAGRIYIGSGSRLLTDWFGSEQYKYICNSVKLGLGSTLVSMDQAYRRSSSAMPEITLDIGNNASLIVGSRNPTLAPKVKVTVGDNGVGVI